MKKILVISGCNPHTVARFESANVITYHIVAGLARAGYDVAFMRAGPRLKAWPEAAQDERAGLESAGVRFLPDLHLGDRPAFPSRLRRYAAILAADPRVLCPGAQFAEDFARALADYRPDLIVTTAAEAATAMTYRSPFPVYAYYGNPDPKTERARLYADFFLAKAWRRPRQWLGLLKLAVVSGRVERAHRKVMRRLAGMCNLARNDTEYYRRIGVPKVTYVRNIWAAGTTSDWESLRNLSEQTAPLKIVGSTGDMGATGNTIALDTICRRILPELKRLLGAGNFEIHLYGTGRPKAYIEPLLGDPHLKVRGFVKDLDAEILSAPVFLVANGYLPLFRVGNSRFLHAWSLGACCVAFEGSREAMPEIEGEKNALLGNTPEQIAQLIVRAAQDKALRRDIGRNGFETVKSLYAPEKVIPSLIEGIEAALASPTPPRGRYS